MRTVNDIMTENCRACLSYFNSDDRKCSLRNFVHMTLGSDRLELMKSVMTSCSVTLFADKEDREISETFICKSCVLQIDQMLNFLQKCIRSEAILKQAADVKVESSLIEYVKEGHEFSTEPKVEIKVESFIRDKNEFEDTFRAVEDQPVENNNKNPKFECSDCNRTFSSPLSLTFHRYKHPGYKPHMCGICHEHFRTLQLIKKHMAQEHDSRHFQQCRQCSRVFTSRHHLTLHEQRTHTGKRYMCGVCKRTFSTVFSLKFHENIHSGQRPFSCTQCSVSFTSPAVLRKHKSSSHPDEFKRHCSFSRKKKLDLHVDSTHEKKEGHPCPECDKKFHDPYSLKNHLNTHLGVKPFLCNTCGSSYTSLSNLRSHFRRIHLGDKRPAVKKYLCHTCGDSFARSSHLQRHSLRKHVANVEKKHECPVCKKRFLEKSDVTGHMKLHDDVKPFGCDQCSKCFRTGWRLQAHFNRVHLGLRPFECPTCSVKFKAKSHLEKHIRTHTGEKPFPCPHCAYTCAEKSNLKKHVKLHLKTIYNMQT